MRASYRPLILTLAFAVAACGFQAPPPKRTPPPSTPPVPVSLVGAMLVVPASTVVDALNARTAREIARLKDQPVDCVVATCRLDLVATRTGPITGRADGGKLALDVPLTATAQLEMKTPLFKTKASSFVTGEAHADTAVALGPDWRLHTQTQGTVALREARLKLGPIKLSFADLWNRNQQHLSAPFFKVLDRQVASSLKIRPEAERLWLKVQRPIRVGKSPAAWLVLEPEHILVSPLATQGDSVAVSLGVDVRAHVVVGAEPPELTFDRALPPPQPLSGPSDRFALVVPVLLPYDQAAGIALQRLDKAPLKIDGARVQFEKLEFLPSGQDVVVAAHFCVSQGWDPFGWFDSCGEGYLRGKPQFDARTNTIRVVNVHYDIATEGVILSVMRALAGDALGKALETKLVFNVASDINKLDAELTTALAKPQRRGVSITGAVDSFGTPSLTWTKDGFLATFPASGTIRADLNLGSASLLDVR